MVDWFCMLVAAWLAASHNKHAINATASNMAATIRALEGLKKQVIVNASNVTINISTNNHGAAGTMEKK